MASRSIIGKKKAAFGKKSQLQARTRVRCPIGLALLLILGSTPPIQSGVAAAPDSTIIKGSDEFEFVYRVKLPEIKGEARLWLPLAKTGAFQMVDREEISIPIKWEIVQDRD